MVGKIEKRQIFVVEDDEAVRASTRTLLEAEGFSVRDFADAEAFLQATDGRDANCIILDHTLSGMAGLDLIALLRAQGVKTPVIIVSGNSRKLAERAAREGVHIVLQKPLAAEALLEWLERLFPDR